MSINSNRFFESLCDHIAHSKTFGQAVELCEEQLQDKTMRLALAVWAGENSIFVAESQALQKLIKKAKELEPGTEDSSTLLSIEFSKFIKSTDCYNDNLKELEQGNKLALIPLIKQLGEANLKILVEYLHLGVISQEDCKKAIIQYFNKKYIEPVFWAKVLPLLCVMKEEFVVEIFSSKTSFDNDWRVAINQRMNVLATHVTFFYPILIIIFPLLEKLSGDQLFAVFSQVFPCQAMLFSNLLNEEQSEVLAKIRKLLAIKLRDHQFLELALIQDLTGHHFLTNIEMSDPLLQRLCYGGFSLHEIFRVLVSGDKHGTILGHLQITSAFIDRFQDAEEEIAVDLLSLKAGKSSGTILFSFFDQAESLLSKLSPKSLFRVFNHQNFENRTVLSNLTWIDYFEVSRVHFDKGILWLKRFTGSQFVQLCQNAHIDAYLYLIGSHPKETLSLISEKSLLEFAKSSVNRTFFLGQEIVKAFKRDDLLPDERERLKKMFEELVKELFKGGGRLRADLFSLEHKDLSCLDNPYLAYYYIYQLERLKEIGQPILAKLVKNRQVVMLKTEQRCRIFPINYLQERSHSFSGYFQTFSSTLASIQDLRDEFENKSASIHTLYMEPHPSVEGITLTKVNGIRYPILHLTELIRDPDYVDQLDLFLDYLDNPFLKPENWEGDIAQYLGNDKLS